MTTTARNGLGIGATRSGSRDQWSSSATGMAGWAVAKINVAHEEFSDTGGLGPGLPQRARYPLFGESAMPDF